MRTTVDLDQDLVERAAAVTRAKTKTELIELGLQALVDLAARRAAMAQGGTLPDLELPPRGPSPPELDPSLGITRNPRR